MLGADSGSVAEQRSGIGLDQPLVRDMGKHKTLDANERRAAGEGDRDRLFVGGGEHLHAQRQRHRAAELAADHRHRRHHLGAYLRREIRPVEHVLDHETVKAGGTVRLGFGHGTVDLSIDRRARAALARAARERPNVKHADEGPGRRKEGRHDLLTGVHVQWCTRPPGQWGAAGLPLMPPRFRVGRRWAVASSGATADS